MAVMQSPKAERSAVLVNRQSGTVRSMGEEAVKTLVTQGFAESPGTTPAILFLNGNEIDATVRKLLSAGKTGRIIVGGGDGTVTSVAGLLAGTDVALGILPLGTMNLLAKTIGIPPDLPLAVAALQRAEVQSVDAARAGERLFLHHVSFGIQPRMVRIREKLGYTSRLTKMLAGARALLAVLFKAQSQRLLLDIDGRHMKLKTPALIVSNNLYENSVWLKQAHLDQGVLGIYSIAPMSPWAFLRLALDLLRGRWRDNLNVQEVAGRRVTISKRSRFGGLSRNIQATIDGELTLLSLPLTISSEPGILRMMVPLPPPA